jgi:RHS repeat-associated protein
MTKETLNGKNTSYAYDVANRKRTVTYPGGKSIEELLNFRNQLVQVKEDGTVIADMGYNTSGQLTTRTYGNGLATQYDYNTKGWISRINAGATVSDLAFAYDPAGNITSRTDLLKPQNSEKYVYDALQRLTQFSRGTIPADNIPNPLKNTTWQYDALGNRISENINGTLTNYTVNAQNEYTAITGGLAFTPQYDANGNLKNDKQHAYQYDYNNQLVKVDDNTATYQYDALGRRISKTTVEGTLNFYYDGDHIIEERNASDVVVATYIFGNTIDDILKMNRNNTGYYYHKDQLGSVIALTGTDGQVVERYQYDPFGAVTFLDASDNVLVQSAIGNRILFTGREYDAETGTYYYRARTMHPQIERFMQADPLLYVDGMNYYPYVGNNPIIFIDPWGNKRYWGEIFFHWLFGKGEELCLDHKDWADYMNSNTKLQEQINEKLREQINNGSSDFEFTFHGEIENGYSTGYELLHGSNSKVGDVTLSGSISYNKELDKHDVNYTVQWNDIIDPNGNYEKDIIYAERLKKIFNPKDYIIRIRWRNNVSL